MAPDAATDGPGSDERRGSAARPTLNTGPLIVIGASAGGVAALLDLGSRLPADFGTPIVVVQHIGSYDGRMPSLMNERCPVPSRYARDGDRVEPGWIAFAPPDHHVVLDGDTLRLLRTAKENHARPAIDPLFRSAAVEWPGPLIGVILTGMLDDGAAGLRLVKESGGIAVVQDPEDADSPSMPRAALAAVAVDYSVPMAQMAELFVRLTESPMTQPHVPPAEAVAIEARLTRGEGNAFALLSKIGRSSRATPARNAAAVCGSSATRPRVVSAVIPAIPTPNARSSRRSRRCPTRRCGRRCGRCRKRRRC